MKTFTVRLTQLTIGTAALVLMLTATPAWARGKTTLKIQTVATNAGTLVVTVSNPAPMRLRGTVTARLLTPHGVVTIVRTVALASGQTGTVSMDVPEKPLDLPLGVVVDDGVPF